jgi:hypothetical protein
MVISLGVVLGKIGPRSYEIGVAPRHLSDIAVAVYGHCGLIGMRILAMVFQRSWPKSGGLRAGQIF